MELSAQVVLAASLLLWAASATSQPMAPDTTEQAPKKGSGQEDEFRDQTRGQILVGAGAWISDCALPLSLSPAFALGGGLSAPMGSGWDFLLRGEVHLGLSGCGVTVPGDANSPPPNSLTLGVYLEPLFRTHLLRGWVFDFGPEAGLVVNPSGQGTVSSVLLGVVLETGLVFGDREQWEILLQLPVGIMTNGDLYCKNHDLTCVSGFVSTPMVVLVHGL